MTLGAGQRHCLGGAGTRQVTSWFLAALGGEKNPLTELTARQQELVTGQEGSQDAATQLRATAQRFQPRGNSSSTPLDYLTAKGTAWATPAFCPEPKLTSQGVGGYLGAEVDDRRFLRIGQN